MTRKPKESRFVMKKLCGLVVAFLLLPALYAEQRADQTWEKAIKKSRRLAQTSNG